MEKKKGRIVLLCLLSAVCLLSNLTALRPDIMECRNLITAREIAQEGHWLVPTMNGELRLEKPPLPTWIAATVETASPDNLWLQRTMPAMAALLWLLFFYLLARRLTGSDDYAFCATLLFLLCYQLVLQGRTATWDIYCHAFMMGGIYFLHRLLSTCTRRQALRYSVGCGLMLGLSFLSKGPVSFYALLLPYLIALGLFIRPRLRGKGGYLALAVLLCIAVSGWWYAYLYIQEPGATQHVVHKETGAWTNHNVRPFWYYWRFFLELGIGAPLMLMALCFPYWAKRLRLRREYLFSLCWVAATLILLSLFPEKKYRYLLPIMPACCLTMAFLVLHFTERGRLWVQRVLVGCGVLYTAGIAVGLPVVAHRYYGQQGHSLSETRTMPELSGVAFLSEAKDELRIEFVYAAGRKIAPVDLNNTDDIVRRLPCAVLTHERVGKALPKQLLERVDTTWIGLYDENHHAPKSRHYSRNLIYNLTLLKARNHETD